MGPRRFLTRLLLVMMLAGRIASAEQQGKLLRRAENESLGLLEIFLRKACQTLVSSALSYHFLFIFCKARLRIADIALVIADYPVS